MLISTTPNVEGKVIKEYRGIVFGEVVSGIDFMKDFAAGITNFIGGRSEAYEKELINARASALREMMERATEVGANAIVGVTIDFEVISQNANNMLLVASSRNSSNN